MSYSTQQSHPLLNAQFLIIYGGLIYGIYDLNEIWHLKRVVERVARDSHAQICKTYCDVKG